MRYRMTLAALAGAITLAACSVEPSNQTPSLKVKPDPELADLLKWDQKAGLLAAQSCDDALGMLQDMAKVEMRLQLDSERRYYHEYPPQAYDDWGMVGAMDAAAGAPMDDNTAAGGGSDKSFSETNVQVAGVDEADLVKTDGDFIYTLSSGDLVIVKAWPAGEMAEVGRVAVPGWSESLYLIGDRAVVLSSGSRTELLSSAPDPAYPYGDWYGWYWDPVTVVTVIDVSDRSAPSVTAQHAFDGNLQATRRIGDRLYLVQMGEQPVYTLSYLPDLEPGVSHADIDAAFEALRKQNEARIEATTLAEWLPSHYEAGPDGIFGAAQVVTPCTEVYSSASFAGVGLLTTITLDLGLESPAPFGSTVGGSWSTVMMSHGSLYLASTNYAWSWWWFDAEQEDATITTHIHELALDGLTGRASWVASGQVPGTVLNQFAMDELDGRLRVATTLDDPSWDGSGSSESYLTVLEAKDGVLAQRGQVGGLGKGERIFAVRFVGERGYVVTFRQVDPLYVLDLRDPAAPAVTGELKIPGFSSYMHPIDDGHLLTIGSDANEQGQVTGLQLQIFDVSDPTAPALTHKQTFGTGWGTWSEAQWDHHAFIYYPSRKLLALPMDSRGEDEGGWYGAYHSMLRLFRVDAEAGLQEAGVIDHDGLIALADPGNQCDPWAWSYGGQARIRRGLFIEDTVYALSSLGMTAHDLGNLGAGPVATVSLLSTEAGGMCGGYYY